MALKRSISIISHVDHGKTTLVDRLMQEGIHFDARKGELDRAMDSNDQEKERGITIAAKNATIYYQDDSELMQVNIIDTPGHADFGGEVERGLSMADGALLLVDASEGPLPQTRFVLQKALQKNLPIILVINKVDRPDARIEEVIDEVYELFLELDATDEQIEFPIIYASAKEGWASSEEDKKKENMADLFEEIKNTISGTKDEEKNENFQALVSNLDSNPYYGRLAVTRIFKGSVSKGDQVDWYFKDGNQKAKIQAIYMFEGTSVKEVDCAEAGDICTLAGIEEITIGDSLCKDALPLPRIEIDEPALSMEISINTSPLSGKSGKKLTSSLIKERLLKELVTNVSMQVENKGEAFIVRGRGELQLAVLIESMRREGFELTAAKPQVILKEEGDKILEPWESVHIQIPEEFMGTLTQLMAARRAKMTEMHNQNGWARLEFLCPARGLIGFRNEFLTQTQGTGLLNSRFDHWGTFAGEIKHRQNGSLVSDRKGETRGFALMNLQERGRLFVGPGEETYEGMIIGENARQEDLDVNPTKGKELTNMRAAGSDENLKLVPHHQMSLDEALEFISDDECVEVTPDLIRLRKVYLDQNTRHKQRKKMKG